MHHKHGLTEWLEIVKTVGKGAHGTVTFRKDCHGKQFAVKSLSKKFIFYEMLEEFVIMEKKVHQNLNHSLICKLYDTYEDENNIYFVMEVHSTLCHGLSWSIIYSLTS